MKVRWLSAIVATIVLAVILLLGSIYKKSRIPELSNNTKSHLTPNQTRENSNNPTPRVGLKHLDTGDLNKKVDTVERKSFDEEESDIRESTLTETEISNMSRTQFIEFLNFTESILPTKADIKQLPAGAIHHTPSLIIQAGKDLGLIKEVLKVHESYDFEAAQFYEKCAKNNERPLPVKALCLTNLIQIKKKKNEPIDLSAYPKNIVELTKLIIDI